MITSPGVKGATVPLTEVVPSRIEAEVIETVATDCKVINSGVEDGLTTSQSTLLSAVAVRVVLGPKEPVIVQVPPETTVVPLERTPSKTSIIVPSGSVDVPETLVSAILEHKKPSIVGASVMPDIITDALGLEKQS